MASGLDIIKNVKLEKTVINLEKHRFEVFVVEDEETARIQIKKLIAEGSSVNIGGSETLHEIGMIEELDKMNIEFQNRYAEGADKPLIYQQAFSCDTYIASANAITQTGEIYNVDGYGNRVAPMIFGPKQVLVVAGWNKIVRTMDEAVKRVQQIAAPANCERLKKDTPCRIIGECADCMSEERICNTYVTHTRSVIKHRIKVILIKKDLGF